MATTVETLSDIPASFRAGDTVSFPRSGGDYKASDDWTRKIVFIKGDDRKTITGSADGDDFSFEIKSQISKSWMPGRYDWIEVATDADGERTTIDQGTVIIQENLVDGSPKTLNRKIYENLNAIMEQRSMPNQDIESSNINGQSINRMTSEQLMKWLNYYGAKVAAEDRQRSASNGQDTGRFTRLSF
jgi:hypothetical protein